jgi:hypothetical protein
MKWTWTCERIFKTHNNEDTRSERYETENTTKTHYEWRSSAAVMWGNMGAETPRQEADRNACHEVPEIGDRRSLRVRTSEVVRGRLETETTLEEIRQYQKELKEIW